MEKEQYQSILDTLEALEMTAADVLDTVATARAELEQTFGKVSA